MINKKQAEKYIGLVLILGLLSFILISLIPQASVGALTMSTVGDIYNSQPTILQTGILWFMAIVLIAYYLWYKNLRR